MKKPLFIILTLLFAVSGSLAQDKLQKEMPDKSQQEILDLYYKYQDAAIKSDYVFMDNILAEDFISVGPNADMKDREKSVADMKEFTKNARIKFLSLDHSDVKVRLSGNIAVVTADWTLKLVPIANENIAPITETGRITLVFEKRYGKWFATVEHVSFRPRRAAPSTTQGAPK
jgi:ketosteroid isomerase-like protein